MKVIVDNLATEYFDEGKGQVILMLHGWQDNLHTFDDLAKFLVGSNRLVRLDLPGFGSTETPKEDWSIADYCSFIRHFLDKVKLSPDIVIGHSFGGRILIKGIADDYFTPKKLILIGSAGLSKRMTLKNIFVMVLAKVFGLVTYIPPLIFVRKQLRAWLYNLVGSDYLTAGNMKEIYLKTIKKDLTSYARKIEIPTLLVWGSDDKATPLADGKKLNSLIRGSRLEVFEHSGHFVHQENAELVAKHIEEFVC